MTKPEERNCNHCGKLYSLRYTNKLGYTYLIDTKHCSVDCARKANPETCCIKIDPGKDVILEEISDFIKNQNHYCTKEEICSGIKRSSKTLTKHGIKVKEENNNLGFRKPISAFQESVGKVLAQEFSEIVCEKSFDGLVGNTGHPLRVDFYIPEIQTVVEADGHQHKYPNHPWAKWNNGTVSEYDEIKNSFFKEQQIKVVRIPYTRNVQKSTIISKLE